MNEMPGEYILIGREGWTFRGHLPLKTYTIMHAPLVSSTAARTIVAARLSYQVKLLNMMYW
jgi:hypothetical protein